MARGGVGEEGGGGGGSRVLDSRDRGPQRLGEEGCPEQAGIGREWRVRARTLTRCRLVKMRLPIKVGLLSLRL